MQRRLSGRQAQDLHHGRHLEAGEICVPNLAGWVKFMMNGVTAAQPNTGHEHLVETLQFLAPTFWSRLTHTSRWSLRLY